MEPFRDRRTAGRALGAATSHLAGQPDLLVLGLPRGGVPVAYELALFLEAPLDLLVVRKIGLPGHEEYGVGAIASGGVQVLNEEALRQTGTSRQAVEEVIARESRELERRERAYRGDRPPLDVRGRTVLLVDDGLATGSTMRAAVMGLRQKGPRSVVVAVPVAPRAACDSLQQIADEVICAYTPESFMAVGQWYEDFSQTTDDEVRALLREAARRYAEHEQASAPVEGP